MANYLYNGVELPALPEWDKEAYPYAHISKFSDSAPTILYISNSFEFKNGSVGWAGTGWIIELKNSFANHAELVDGAWEPFSEISGMRNGSYVFSVLWSNFDVLNEDGSVYLAASEPIPVTAPALDPLSLWMGWKAGNWVARQRGKA